MHDGEKKDPPAHEHVIFTDLDGVEGVLVDLETKQYYQLNETASVVWRGLAEGRSPAAIAEQMTATYDLSSAQALASVARAIQELRARRLVK
jgi:Coenzyme PQQ synthesis protein D (PqqD)